MRCIGTGLSNLGIRSRSCSRRSFSHGEASIRFLGVWDTVGALGIPLYRNPLTALANRRWQFHNVELSGSVQAAYQALAIDETRRPFEAAVWEQGADAEDQTLEQVWFAGCHSDVGGGYADTALSDLSLGWLTERARSCGLVFRKGAFVWPENGARPPARTLTSCRILAVGCTIPAPERRGCWGGLCALSDHGLPVAKPSPPPHWYDDNETRPIGPATSMVSCGRRAIRSSRSARGNQRAELGHETTARSSATAR
jgi:hypothetical protein